MPLKVNQLLQVKCRVHHREVMGGYGFRLKRWVALESGKGPGGLFANDAGMVGAVLWWRGDAAEFIGAAVENLSLLVVANGYLPAGNIQRGDGSGKQKS